MSRKLPALQGSRKFWGILSSKKGPFFPNEFLNLFLNRFLNDFCDFGGPQIDVFRYFFASFFNACFQNRFLSLFCPTCSLFLLKIDDFLFKIDPKTQSEANKTTL